MSLSPLLGCLGARKSEKGARAHKRDVLLSFILLADMAGLTAQTVLRMPIFAHRYSGAAVQADLVFINQSSSEER